MIKPLVWSVAFLFVLGVIGCGGLFLYGWMESKHYNDLTDTHDLGKRASEIAEPYVAKRKNVRLTIGISQRGKRFIQEFASPGSESSQPKGKTIYEIGSITKVFTGVLLAHLAQEGQVRLDQPISELLPPDIEVDPKVGAITLRQLSTHTAGMPRLPKNLDLTSDNPYAEYSAELMYEDLAKLGLKSEPGKSSTYSNYGVGLLGHLLALKAGKPYEALLKEKICEPLKLVNTSITLTDEQKSRFIDARAPNGKAAPAWDFDVLAPAGALHSDVEDLLTFLEANLKPPETELGKALEEAQEVHFKSFVTSLGLGWHIQNDPYISTKIHWHNGGTAGFMSFAGIIRSHDVAVVVLSNYGDAFSGDSSIDDAGFRLLRYATKISLE